MQIVRTVSELRAVTHEWRAREERSALVPTMGALHAGHLALVEAGRVRADRVIVTIFVNPTQFGETEDLDRYPRRETEDAKALVEQGCDLLFTPPVEEIYPPGFATTVLVAGVSEELCGAARPGHFDGVATIVTKLLNQARPDIALFGEKDYQQLALIRRLARDLDIPVDIVGVPTVREEDGLAMSSRNTYLTAQERRLAPTFPKVLRNAAAAIEAGADIEKALAAAARRLAQAGFAVDYVELRAADDLAPLSDLSRPARILAAVFLGKTRLIDNLPVCAAP